MTKHIIYLFAILILHLSCQNQQSQNCDLGNFVELKSKAEIVKYEHIKSFENKFNSSFYHDTSDVSIFQLDGKQVGFHIKSKEYEWIYNSNKLIELNHSNKTKSIDSLIKISDSPLWDKNLLSMLDTLSSKKCDSKIVHKTPYLNFSNEFISTSKIDSNLILINELEYTFPKIDNDHLSHKEIIIRGSDTLQIQNHFFKNIRYDLKNDNEAVKIGEIHPSYKILKSNEDLPFGKESIKEGEKLVKKIFKDIENNSIKIVNSEKKHTLIVFSFIGCTPCEIALKQLKEDKMEIVNEVDLYYSSFQNSNSAVKKYLENKGIFHNAFGIESKMIDEFRLPVGPTFVLIDSNGRIKKIIEGFDDSVLNTLSEIINT